MLTYISLLENIINESVDFYPAEKTVNSDGIMIGWPDNATELVEIDCYGCDGTGLYGTGQDKINCPYCHGTGKEKETKYLCPMLNVSNGNVGVVINLLGIDPDIVERDGWIPPQQLPAIRRHLIRVKNGELDSYGRESSETRDRRVDMTGDIPRISSGPRIIDGGVNNSQVERYIDRMLEIIDWAQKNNCGVSWA